MYIKTLAREISYLQAYNDLFEWTLKFHCLPRVIPYVYRL